MAKYLWGAAIFTLPFTISTVLWQSAIFGQGSYNAYTSFSLYGSEVFLFLAFAIWSMKMKRKTLALGGLILGLTLLSVVMSQDPTSSLLNGIHILAAVIALIFTVEKVLKPKTLVKIFLATLTIQAIIAIAQFVTQGSLGLHMLGESLIGTDVAGVAKFSLGSFTMVRAAGTLPHANILAGFLLVGILLSREIKGWRIPKILLWIAFFVAFSKAAILALIVAFIVTKKIPHKWAYVALIAIAGLIVLAQESLIERLQYLKISLNMLALEPIGVGLGQFTARMQEFTQVKLQHWQFQPVHNVYFLIANELGWWALGLFLIGLKKLYGKIPKKLGLFAAILTIGLFDHYLISLPQGLLLSGLTFGYILKNQL